MGVGLLSCCEKPKEEGVKKKLNELDESLHNVNSPIIGNGFSKGGTLRYDYSLPTTSGYDRTSDDRILLQNMQFCSSSTTNNNILAMGIGNNKINEDTNKEKNIFQTEDNRKSNINPVKKLFFYIPKFELTYKFFDDFGLQFQPILNFKITQSLEKTFIQKSEDENSIKGDQTHENSFNGDINRSSYVPANTNEQFENTKRSSINVIPNFPSSNTGFGSDNKIFNFDATEIINVNELDDWANKKLKLTIFNKSKYDQYCAIQVGFCQIPLCVLKQEGVIEGKIPIRNKMTKIIGYIYTRIKCLYEKDEEMLLKTDDAENVMITSQDLFFSISESFVDYYKLLMRLQFENLDLKLQRRFKLQHLINTTDKVKELDEKLLIKEQLKGVEKIINDEYEIKEITEILSESLSKQQHILIYGILNYLIQKIENKNQLILDEFLDIIYEKEIGFFDILLVLIQSSNLALIKEFCYFLYLLIEFYREIEIESENCCVKLNFDLLFNTLLDDFGHLNDLLERLKDFEYEELEEVREIIYWMLNDLMLLITPNFSDKIIKVEKLNKLYSIGFNNCIKFISKPKYVIKIFSSMGTDSEIAALIVKVFRKALQILLDDSNNYILNLEDPGLVSIGIKDLIISEDKTCTFLLFIRMCLTQYVNYPEIFSNTLLVLIYFCLDSKYRDIVRHILDHIEISLICSGFDMYRGNLKNIGKNINYFFYKLISHITELNKNSEDEEISSNLKPSEIKEICNDILKLFRMKQTKAGNALEKSKTLASFIKYKNLELHNQLCVIGANLTKNIDACKLICKDKCYLVQHIIEYFFELNKDSIKRYLEKFKHNKKEKVNLYISIITNTLQTFDNLIITSKSTKDFFLKFLNLKNFTKNKVKYHITDVMDTAATTLNTNNINLKKISDNFMQNYD